LLACVPATQHGRVHIQEVARQSAAEQSADLVSHSVVGMQDRPNGELNGIVSTPVDSQLGELTAVLPAGEQVDIATRPVTHPVG
jgi:hypothetical protein